MEDLFQYAEDNSHISVHWDSASDFMEYFTTPENRGRRIYESENRYHSPGWYGVTDDYKEVLRRSVVGDEGLTRELQEKIVAIEKLTNRVDGAQLQTVEINKRKPRYGRSGDELDIHRVYSGDLDKAWRSTIREKKEVDTNLVTMVVDLSYNAHVDCRKTMWTAAVVLKILNDLISAGSSVRVIVQWSWTNYWNGVRTMTNSMVVKEYGQQIAIERLAAMSHAGFLRAWGFLSVHVQDKYRCNLGSGTAVANDGHVPVMFKDDVKHGKIKMLFIPRALNVQEAVSSINVVKRKLKKEEESK